MPRLDRILTLYLWGPLQRLAGGPAGNAVPILAYHSVSDNLFGYSHPYYQINTPPAIFAQQMRWLRNEGFRAIDVAEACAVIESDTNTSKRVVITFDDGYRDFYTDAMDIMKQCGFTATIFLTTGRIRNHSARFEGANYLTWSDVRELAEEGIRFGSHTVTHPDLRSMDPELIDYEIGCSKETIEQELGSSIDCFSYPFSFPEEDKGFTRFLEDLLRNQGFQYGVSTILGRATKRSNNLFLPRLPVNGWDDNSLLRAKVEGKYDWLHTVQLLKKATFHNQTIMQQTAPSSK